MSRSFYAAGLAFAFAACSTSPKGNLPPEDAASAFNYLAAKYDRDGDDAIEPWEYTRDSESFVRLDANSDGQLTGDDFPDELWASDFGIRDLPADVRERLGARYAARAVVLAYFCPDAKPGDPVLSREALSQGFARLDLDASGALDSTEFARATDRLAWGGPGNAWEVLLAAVDAPLIAEPATETAGGGKVGPTPPPDGQVGIEELLQYHEGMAGPEGILRGPPGVDPLAVGPGLAGDGPPVGSLAPDFELAPPEGGLRIRLSEWRGKKPVALVFGSYT